MKINKIKSERGVALIMVLAGLALLIGIVVEFSYNSSVNFDIAMNHRDRIQAEYLAQSGVSFAKLLLKYDSEAKKIVDDRNKKASKPENKVYMAPIYQQIPINTQLMRCCLKPASGEASEPTAEASEPSELEGETEATVSSPEEALNNSCQSELIQLVCSNFDPKSLEEFLDFEGDFSIFFEEEDTKFNVNAFYTLNPEENSYDRHKSVLYYMLLGDEFADLFEDKYQGAKELAQNIADYIDPNDAYNEDDGQERGREGSQDSQKFEMKNAKLLSLEELMMVPGMTDAVYQRLAPYLTVYGKDEKINLCRANQKIVTAMVMAYVKHHEGAEPIQEDNQDLIDKTTEVVNNYCPDLGAMAKAMDEILNIEDESEDDTPTAPNNKKPASKPTKKAPPKDPYAGTVAEMAKEDLNYITIISRGESGESMAQIKTVIDRSGQNPRQWKTLYWRAR